ncbi:CAP domain-containing protein [Demequina capsici]|uniref:CAP domain-containing protein n=1 Tax=Demequina capsici TaxID=3075620 RepID=A0AA96JDC0_9MICO|nr:CAP domain-containing protein [Demequina sp. PMTSA13]WNM27871.1 CAP domain-containing protein [Demequina sp. PMTSA13]
MEETEVKVRREPRRRWYWAVLAGLLPLAVVGTSVSAAASWIPADVSAAPDTAQSAPSSVATASVKAEGSVENADISSSIPAIEVSRSPEPVPEPVAPVTTTKKSTKKSTSKSSGSTSSSTSSSGAASAQSYTDYCSNPASPYSAGSSAKSLLTAANKERARLGLNSLGWSGSLANAAQSWSQTMLDTDTLSHSGRGQENVGYTYNSLGLSLASGITIIHQAWMHSYGHCTNIMYPGYSVMGAGAVQSGDGTTVYATENFG